MRGPLSVVIDDGMTRRTVAASVSGLKFSKQSDGGHKAASFKLTVPRGTFTDLGPSDKVYIYDGRTSLPLWEGYTDAPTPTMGPNGESYEMSALGGMIRAGDETRPLIYIDRDVNNWANDTSTARNPDEANRGSASAQFETITDGAGLPGLRIQLTDAGGPVATNAAAATVYRATRDADMEIGALRVVYMSGKTDIGYRTQLYTSGSGVQTIGDPNAMNGATYDQSFYVGVNFTASDVMSLILRRTGGATNIADDLTWTDFYGICVLGRRMNRASALLAGPGQLGSAQSVLAHEVVEDLLGRLMTFCDIPTSTVDTTPSKTITQLTYTDGTTAQGVLDDLATYEPDFLWEILHSVPGGHIFNYRRWPTTARYEISTRDGYTESGSDADLCNRVAVSWTDSKGMSQTTIVTASADDYPALQALEMAGRIRDADPVSLPEGQGSEANAQMLGESILADAAGQPTAARALVRRPIRDLLTGQMVMPWEIETGYVVRVRETGREHRLTEMEYDDDSCSASLTLGYPSLTRDQRIAQLAA